MMTRGKAFERTVADWQRDILIEAHRDQVSLSQIIDTGRVEFHLTGSVLESFANDTISYLLANGVWPVDNLGCDRNIDCEEMRHLLMRIVCDEFASSGLAGPWLASRR